MPINEARSAETVAGWAKPNTRMDTRQQKRVNTGNLEKSYDEEEKMPNKKPVVSYRV